MKNPSEEKAEDLKNALQELMEGFDVVPKESNLAKSEYRYRLLMVQMLERLLEEQKIKLRELEVGLRVDKGMGEPERKPKSKSNLKGFDNGLPWVDQCLYFIKREGRPLLFRELVACLCEAHPEAVEDPYNFNNNLSVSLSQSIKRRRIQRHSLPKRKGGWYYPNSWGDGKGKLKKEYLVLID